MKSKEYHNKDSVTNHRTQFEYGHIDFKSLNEDVLIVEEKKIKSNEEDDNKSMDSLENKVEDKQLKLFDRTPEIATTLTNLSETNKTTGNIIKLFCVLNALNI